MPHLWLLREGRKPHELPAPRPCSTALLLPLAQIVVRVSWGPQRQLPNGAWSFTPADQRALIQTYSEVIRGRAFAELYTFK